MKNFPKATERNKIKRRLKEHYRRKKTHLYNLLAEQHKQLAIMVIYQSREIMDYIRLEAEIDQFIHALAQKYETA